jgi:hypothetical protein
MAAAKPSRREPYRAESAVPFPVFGRRRGGLDRRGQEEHSCNGEECCAAEGDLPSVSVEASDETEARTSVERFECRQREQHGGSKQKHQDG